jgi:hypothetical protein
MLRHLSPCQVAGPRSYPVASPARDQPRPAPIGWLGAVYQELYILETKWPLCVTGFRAAVEKRLYIRDKKLPCNIA